MTQNDFKNTIKKVQGKREHKVKEKNILPNLIIEDDAIKYIARVIADDMPSQFPEPTEEDSWDQTLDYLSLDDPYDAWEGFKDFWNSFKKYDEDCDDDTELMLAAMIDDEKLKKWCSTRFSEEDRAVFDFEIIKPEVDYE